MINRMQLLFSAVPENESLARTAVSAFMLPYNPTLEILSDVKTAVSEAVTNSIIHGYPGQQGEIRLEANCDEEGLLTLEIADQGVGIRDIPQAMEPFYSSDPYSERSGMGFTVMQSFMDALAVTSSPDHGTTVRMQKRIILPQERPAKRA